MMYLGMALSSSGVLSAFQSENDFPSRVSVIQGGWSPVLGFFCSSLFPFLVPWGAWVRFPKLCPPAFLLSFVFCGVFVVVSLSC